MTAPKPLPGFTPRKVQSPSALKAFEICPRMWGLESLEGRRDAQPLFHELPPKPAKAPDTASAVEKAKAKAKLKAYNKAMRPAQGTALHYIWELYYRHKVPGAWHPPIQWRAAELDELWQTRPGQIALSGREHLPTPSNLAEVWIEELVSVDLEALDLEQYASHNGLEGWWVTLPPELLIGGTPDLVTMRYPFNGGGPRSFHLYDYKSTISIDEYAHTAEELTDDEQANIYGLAIMQRHGLDALDCTWVYFQTDDTKPPRSVARHFRLERAKAEAIVRKLVARAAAMQEVQDRYLAEKSGLLGRRLHIIQALDTNDMACNNFAGCPHLHTRGGTCKPRKSTMGEAMRKQAAEKRKTQGRRDAAKADKAASVALKVGKGKAVNMMTPEQALRLAELEAKNPRNFKENQEMMKLKKLAPAGESTAAEDVETTGEEAPEAPLPEAERPRTVATPAPAKPAKAKADVPSPATDEAGIYLGATRVALDKTSPMHKAILKICKAYEAFEAAKAGE